MGLQTDRIIGLHAVQAAIGAGRTIERVLIARGASNPRIQALLDECRRRRLAFRLEPREQLDRIADGGVHQGVIAFAQPKPHVELSDILAEDRADGLIVLADGVEDPHNLGAIVRSAEAAGVQAVVVPRRRSASSSDAAGKAAAGALERLPLVRTVNINRAIEQAQKAGYWVYGLDERGDQQLWDVDLRGKIALVVGREGEGLHRLTFERCDGILSIPMALDGVSSLNVSVATGVALFEVVRQRR